jgi:predicted DCC family thiol-disulfide oxidoreductase YuxK
VDEPWLLRWLVAVFYVGAGLHKLLNGDGSWGQFFGHGAGETLRDGGSMALAATLTELGLGAGFLVRRLYPWCVWMGVLFHAWVTWFGGGVSTMFLYAMPAAYLVFVDWPRTPLIVLYDGDCGFCNKTREWISRADFEGLYDWRPYQSGAGVAYGIPQKALEERAYVVVGERIYSGFQAFRILALYNPLTYFAIAVLLAVLAAWEPSIRNALLGALILFFSPLFRPLGEAAYKLVARNRHRLPPKTCKAPEL